MIKITLVAKVIVSGFSCLELSCCQTFSVLSRRNSLMSCVGVHLYHAYNNPVSDILPDSSLSCTEKDWIASRRYRDSQAYRIVLLIGNHYASVLV